MEKICGIYMIENVVSKHIYIGSSKDVEGRIQGHSNKLDSNKHCNMHLQSAYNKYGFDSFVYDILITCHPDMLLFYEQQFLDAWNPEYNMSGIAGKIEMTPSIRYRIGKNSGKARLGKSAPWNRYKRSIYTRQKMSDAKTGNRNWFGKHHSNVTREKLKLAATGNKNWLGKHHSYETIQKMGLIHSNISDGTRQKMSESQRGKIIPDDVKKKMSDAKVGKMKSEETKCRMSKAKKKWWAERKANKV